MPPYRQNMVARSNSAKRNSFGLSKTDAGRSVIKHYDTEQSRYNDFPYLEETAQGYKIVYWGMDKNLSLVVIFLKESGSVDKRRQFAVGIGYDAQTGTWAQGRYDLSYRDALSIVERYEKYPNVDIRSDDTLNAHKMDSFAFNEVGGDTTKAGMMHRGFDLYGKSGSSRDFDKSSPRYPTREQWTEEVSTYVNGSMARRKQFVADEIAKGNRKPLRTSSPSVKSAYQEKVRPKLFTKWKKN